jgi:hypothetical protein
VVAPRRGARARRPGRGALRGSAAPDRTRGVGPRRARGPTLPFRHLASCR